MGHTYRILMCLGLALWTTVGVGDVAPSVASGQVILQPGPIDGKDAMISGFHRDANNGELERLIVNEYIGSGDYRARSLIQFGLSGIPGGATILSAACALYFYDSDPLDREHTVGVYRITEAWSESVATWNSAAGIYDPSYCFDTEVVSDADYGWYSWDVTRLVRGWLDGVYPNHGIMLKCTDGNSVTQRFHSSDAADADLRPKLSIMYMSGTTAEVPIVSNVYASQRPGRAGTGALVDISYDIEDADSDSAYIVIQVSNDDGSTFTVPARMFTGDVGRVTTGRDKQVVWHAGQDVSDVYWSACRVNVIARDISAGVVGEGLVGYWPFDGGAYDESGHGNHGTVYGTTLTEDRLGIPNSAYRFDGVDDYIDFGNDESLKPGLPVTLSGWMLCEGLLGNRILMNNYNDSGYYGVWVSIYPDPWQLVTGFGDGGPRGYQFRRTKHVSPAPTEVWFHFAGVIRGSTDMDIYIDGVNQEGTYSGSGGPLAYDDSPSIIGGIWGSDRFKGILDEVRIYERALLEEEIQTLYQFGGEYQSAQSNTFLLNSGAALRAWMPNVPAVPGKTVRVPIHIDDVTGHGVVSADLLVTYLPEDGIAATGVETDGTLFEGIPAGDIQYHVTPGQIDIAAMSAPDTLSGRGILLYLVFEVSGDLVSVGGCALHIEELVLNDGEPSVRVEDGRVDVTELGDVSYNFRVSAYDAGLLILASVGEIVVPDPVYPNLRVAVGDVNGDGEMDAVDGVLVLQYAVGMISMFPGSLSKVVTTVGWGDVEEREDGLTVVPIEVADLAGVLAGELDVLVRGAGELVDVVQGAGIGGYVFGDRVEGDRVRIAFAGVRSGVGSGRIAELWFDGLGDELVEVELVSVRLNGDEVAMGERVVKVQDGPGAYRLDQNYPNPFNSGTIIPYDVGEFAVVHLVIYSLSGQRVRTLVDGGHSAGQYRVMWNGLDDAGHDVATGVYLCRMEGSAHSVLRKLLLVR